MTLEKSPSPRSPLASIPTHSAIALELLFNAVDSGAESINLTVDLWRNQIRCRDNGSGIAKHELPNIFKVTYSQQISKSGRFRRNTLTIARIAPLADIAILTRSSNDQMPRRVSKGRSQYIAPLFAPGTEIVVTAIFETFPLRAQLMATAAWKREELHTIRALINTVLLNIPDVGVTLDLGNIKVELAKCITMEERWKQITGTQLLVDSDGRMIHFRAATPFLFASTFTKFIVNDFPVSSVILDGFELSPHPNAITKVHGEIKDLQWTSEGLTCDVKSHFPSPHQSILTISTESDKLTQMTVIGIFSSSFIICELNNILYAIDQHAAHERVLLDEMLKSMDSFVGTSDLKIPVTVPIDAGRCLLPSLRQDLKRLGWNVVQVGGHWQLYSIPVVDGVAVDNIDGFIEYVNEFDDGVQRGMPNCLMHALQTRACKRAIKFGDVISDERAHELIRQLAACKLPNHCAHGRTVIAPIFDFDHPFTQFTRVQTKYKR
jgi:DNA mismatch repair ATPase MutL